MKFHVSTSIAGLLSLKERDFRNMVRSVKDENGEQPTAEEFAQFLREELKRGHHFIPSDKCDNFDPVRGCLGHPSND